MLNVTTPVTENLRAGNVNFYFPWILRKQYVSDGTDPNSAIQEWPCIFTSYLCCFPLSSWKLKLFYSSAKSSSICCYYQSFFNWINQSLWLWQHDSLLRDSSLCCGVENGRECEVEKLQSRLAGVSSSAPLLWGLACSSQWFYLSNYSNNHLLHLFGAFNFQSTFIYTLPNFIISSIIPSLAHTACKNTFVEQWQRHQKKQ